MDNQSLKAYGPCAGPTIFHLFYDDNCLLIAWAILCNAITLAIIIGAYSSHSGQLANYTKSHISFSPTTPIQVKTNILSIFVIFEKTLL